MTSTFIRYAKAVSAERYNDMLNILPPLNWCGIGSSTESFRMSEMLDIDTVVIFCRIGSQHFELVAGDRVTHHLAIAHCTALVQTEAVPA